MALGCGGFTYNINCIECESRFREIQNAKKRYGKNRFRTHQFKPALLAMDKIKLLTVTVIALLLLNLGTLGFLLLQRQDRPMGRPGMHREPKEIIIERLHFDASQQRQYEELIHAHRKAITEIEDQARETKNRLYLYLLKSQPDTAAEDSLIGVLANYQKQIETTHFKHFQDIKKICHPDQLEAYNDLTTELSRIFSKPPPPGHD